MRIVLDTNIFQADFRMEGNAFLIFLSALHRIGGFLNVPQVVLDELTHHYTEELRDISAVVTKMGLRWQRLTGHAISECIDENLVRSEASNYSHWLNSRLKTLGAVILAYPKTPHSEIAKRAIERRRPFQESGSGYRDALIWETVKGLCSDRSSTICLITRNRRDFGDGPNIHAHLLDDLVSSGHPADLIRVFYSLEEFNVQLVIPKLERLDDLLRRFSAGEVPEFSLHSWVEWELKDLLQDDDWAELLVGLEQGHSHARISTIGEAPVIDVDDVRLLHNGDVLVAASASIECEVAVHGDREAYYRHEDVRCLWGDEAPTDNSTGWFPFKAKVAVSLILKKDSFELLSAEVDEIDGDYVSIQANPHPRRSA